jgi:phosphate/sulfate permease
MAGIGEHRRQFFSFKKKLFILKFTLKILNFYCAAASWIATIPFSMGLTAAIYWIIQKIILG